MRAIYFYPNSELKIKIVVIKKVAKKRKSIDLMPTMQKTLLSKILKVHRIRFGDNHNHVKLIIQKSVLLLN